MLSDEIIDKVIERLINRMEKANEYILKEIARSIKEIGTINPSKLNQLIMSLKYGSNYKNMVRQISKYTKINQKEIKKIFEEVAKSDYKFAKQFYEYRDRPYVPYRENKELVEQTQALARITGDECVNLTQTNALGFGLPGKDGNIVYRGIKETYYNALDEAVLSISQGKETFDMAMYRQLKNIAESGLKVVYPTTYIDKDGVERHYTRRLDSAIRMNLRSGLRQLHNENQQLIGEQIDSDGVEISVHMNPAEDHEEAQGKQFSTEEFKKLQETGQATTYDNIKIDLHRELKDGSEALSFRPISEYNCYHYIFSIVLGVNKPQYSNKQLEQIRKDNEKGFEYEGKHYTMYEGTQLQRQIETEMRKQKEVEITAKAGGNEQLIGESQLRQKILSRKYKEICNISGLKPKVDRMKVVGYTRTTKAEISNMPKLYKDATQEWLDNAKPGEGKVFQRKYYVDKNGIKYKVDGKNVVLDPSNEEIETAHFLKDTFGGNVYINPKINNPESVQSADYLWRNSDWDRKGIGKNATSLTRAVDNIIKDHEGQAHNFIIDTTGCKIDHNNILEQSQKEFYRRNWLNKLIIVNNNKLIKVYVREEKH